jgi:hypothetical protein
MISRADPMAARGTSSRASKFFPLPVSRSRAEAPPSGLAPSKAAPLSQPISRLLPETARAGSTANAVASFQSTRINNPGSKISSSSTLSPTREQNAMLQLRHCDVTGYHAAVRFSPPPTGSFDDGKRVLSREGLGTDSIDGLSVIGTRETLTMSAGVVGNSQPLTATREFWYSPDLQVNLFITRKDPREGSQVIRVGELSRTEPDPAIFQIPSGFVVESRGQSARPEN